MTTLRGSCLCGEGRELVGRQERFRYSCDPWA
jgi:hypothetical protein